MVPSYMSPWPTHGSSLTVLFPSFLKSESSSMSAYSNCWIYPEYFIVSLSLLIETESPLDSKEIKPVNLKGNQPWILIGRTDAETEAPVFWLSDANRWLIGKVPDVRMIEGRRRRGCQRMRRLEGITNAKDMNLGKLQEMVRDREAWRAAVQGVAKNWAWLGTWTATAIPTNNTLQQPANWPPCF